jgi:hypothetical protein
LPADGASVPSVASILVVFFAFGVATVVVLWLMDMLADALRRRIIGRGGRYPGARQSPTTEPEGPGRPAPGDAEDGAQRSRWRRLFER